MRFQLTLLGTSAAVPVPGRHCSAAMLRTEKTDVLNDCGEGTQLQIKRAGIGMGRCSHILITHLHGDHYFGLPGLLSSLSLGGRTTPLTIVSPQHLRPRIAPLLELDRYSLSYELTCKTYEATEPTHLLSVGDVDISAFPLQHRVPTNGYLIREKERPGNINKLLIEEYNIPWTAIKAIKAGADFTTAKGKVIPHHELVTPAPAPRSFAYCSDTLYFPQLADFVRGVDLLYHEATFLHDMEDDAVAKGHATAHQAALTARNAGVGRLVMGHFSTRYDGGAAHETEARKVFPNSDAGQDLWHWEVPFLGRETN
ncbi:MAG: ribonuclease Z [Bacteroidota bacterium]